MTKLDQILKKIEDIPTLPKIVNNVISIIDDPKVHILEIADLIQQDFILTTRLLKISNSAYYGQKRKIETVLEALVLLGLKRVKELIVTASTYKILNKRIEGYLLEKGNLWKHSLSVAIASEMISNEVKNPAKDSAYIAGLLHDVGKLILAHYVEDDFIKIINKIETENITFDNAEEEIIGFSHAILGAKVLEKWNFPKDIVNAVEYHHKPDEPEAKNIASIVHIADAASLMLGEGIGADGLLYFFNENAFDKIGFKKENFESILSKLSDAINSMRLVI